MASCNKTFLDRPKSYRPYRTEQRMNDYRNKRVRVSSCDLMRKTTQNLKQAYDDGQWNDYGQGFEKKGVEVDDAWANIEQKPIDHPDNDAHFDSLQQKYMEVHGEDQEIIINWLIKHAKFGVKTCATPRPGKICYTKSGEEYERQTCMTFLKPDKPDAGANDIFIRVTNLTASANDYEPKVYQFTRGQMEWALRGLYRVYENTCRRVQEARFIKGKLGKGIRRELAQSVAYMGCQSIYNLYHGITWKKYCSIRDATASSFVMKRCLKNETAYEYIALRELYPDIDKQAEEEFEKQVTQTIDVPEAVPYQAEVIVEKIVPQVVTSETVAEKLNVCQPVAIKCTVEQVKSPVVQIAESEPVPVIASIIAKPIVHVIPARRPSVVLDKITEINATKEEVNTTDCESCDEKEFVPMQIISKSENLYDTALYWPLRAGEMDILYEYVDSCVYIDDVLKCLKRRVFTIHLNDFIRKVLSSFTCSELATIRLSPERIVNLCRENQSLFMSLCKPLFIVMKQYDEQKKEESIDEPMELEESIVHIVNRPSEECTQVIQNHLQKSSCHHFACCCSQCVRTFVRRSYVSSWYKQLRDDIDLDCKDDQDEMLHPQMAKEDKGEDPECHENVTKDANITFVDEREVVSDAQNFQSNITAKDPNKDVADTEWTLKDVLTREVLIRSSTWQTANVTGQRIFVDVPLSLDKNNDFRLHGNILRNFAYHRAGVSYRVQVNGTKFHCGRLICVYRPVSFIDQEVSPYNYTQYPHCFIDASISNSATLFVPFSSIFSYFATNRNLVLDSYPMSLGSFRIYVWSVLQAAKGASTELGYNVYVKLVNPELHQSMVRAGDLPPIPNDMPVTQMAKEDNEQPVVLRTTQPLCHGDLAKHHAIRLGLTKQDSSQHEVAIKGSSDNFDISKFLGQYTLLSRMAWSAGKTDSIASFPVTPSFVNQFVYKGGYTRYSPSMLAFLSRMFVYWRGSLTYKLQVISTQFHAGRLMITFIPYNYQTSKDILVESTANTIVFDIEEKKEMEFTVPFMSTRPWLRSDHFVGRTVDVSYTSLYSDGIINILPSVPLVCPDNVAKTIELLLYVKGGDDLEFALPAPLDDIYLHVNHEDSKFNCSLLPYSIKYQNSDKPKQLIIGKSREFIMDLFIKGKKLLQDGYIEYTYPWVKSQATKLGTYHSEVLNWVTRAQLTRYYDNDSNEWQYILALNDKFQPSNNDPDVKDIKATLKLVLSEIGILSKTVKQNVESVSAIQDSIGPRNNAPIDSSLGLSYEINKTLGQILERMPKNAEEKIEDIDKKLTGLLTSFELHAGAVSARLFQYTPHIKKITEVKSDTGNEVENTNDIKSNVTDIKSKCVSILDKTEDVIERLNYQNGKLNTLDDNLKKIEADTSSLKSIITPITDIETSVKNIDAGVSGIRNDVGTIDTNVQNISSDTSAMKSKVDSIDDTITATDTSVSNIDAVTTKLPDALKSIDDWLNYIDTYTDKTREYTNEINIKLGKLDNIDKSLVDVMTTNSSLDEETKQIKDNLVALKTEVTTFNDAVKPNIDSASKDIKSILTHTQLIPTISNDVDDIKKSGAVVRANVAKISQDMTPVRFGITAMKDDVANIKQTTVNIDNKISPRLMLKPQSKVEEFVSGETSNEPRPLVITKGFRHAAVNKHTVGENAMNVRQVLHRFYNIYNSPIINNPYDYVLFTIPVRPGNSVYTNKGDADEIYKEHPYSSHLAWFSSLYTFWHGSLRYRVIYDVNSEVVVLHHPTCVKDFTVEYGVSPFTIQQNESYAAAMAVSRTQNAIEVEVPFMSPYNQLLVAYDKKTPKMYTQNGALLIAIRSKSQNNDNVHFSLFQAAGSNFSLSVHRPAPMVWQPNKCASDITSETKHVVVGKPDMRVRHDEKSNQNIETPLESSLSPIQKAGIATPSSYSWEQYKFIASFYPEADSDMLKPQMGILDSIPGYQALKNVSKTLDNVHQVSEDMKELTKSANELINPKQDGYAIINNYSSIAVNVLMMYTLVDCFKEIFKSPTIANFIKFGSVFSSLIGYNFSHSMKLLLNQLTSWCVSECTVPQPQSLNEDMAEVIESVEDKIVPILAVLGTIIYAYVFNIIPSLSELKQWMRQFFESNKVEQQLKTQGKTFEPSNWLKNAHFSFMGFTAIGKIYEKFCEYVQLFIDWILDRENPQVAAQRKAGEYKDELLALIKEIDELDYDPTIETAFQDPLVHDRFYALMDKANKMHDVFVKNPSADKYILSIVRETRKRALTLLQKLEKEKPTSIVRYAPFTICLSGDTGTGKTQCLPDIIHAALDAIDAPKHNRVYNKSITKDGFWNGYKNQSAVAWDEFGQSTEADDVVPEILTLCGNEPYQINMAALEDKGRYFTSKLIVMTTNVPYERFANTLRHPEAFLRRRNYMIGVQLRDGDLESTIKRVGFDPEYSHCVYARLDPMTNKVLKPNMTFAELKQDIQMEMKLWDQKQKNILQHYETSQPDAVLPRGLTISSVSPKINPDKRCWETDDESDEEDEPAILEVQAEQEVVECKENLKVESVPGDGNCFYHSLIKLGFNNYKTPQAIRKELLKCPFLSDELRNQVNYLGESVPVENWATQDTCEVIADWFHCSICLHVNGEPQCWRFGKEDPVYHINYQGNSEVGHFSPMVQKVEKRIVKDRKVKLTDYEKFERDCYLERLESLNENDYAILVEKMARSMTLKEKSSWFYNRCKKYLNSLSDKIVNWFRNNSKLATILGCIILLSSAGALLLKDTPQSEAGYSADPKHLPRRIVIAEGYDQNPKALARRFVRAEMMEVQGCEDMNAYALKNKIHQAIVPVAWNKDDGIKGALLSVHIGGSIILLPWHFFRQAKDGQRFWLKHRYNHVDVEFQSKNMVRIKDNDWVLYDCGPRLEPRKQLIKYFISESDLSRIKKLPTLLLGIDDDGERIMQFCPEARYNAKSVYGEAEKQEYYEQRGWETITTTKSGDCGSLHLGLSNAIPCPRKIIGMHVAGLETKSRGFAVLVVQEQLQKAWNILNEREPQVLGMPIPEEVKVPQSLSEIRVIPEGDYTLYGKMTPKMSPAQPQKSSFIPTPFVHMVKNKYPMTKKPCHLRQFTDLEGNYVSPLRNALSKYGKQTLKFPDKNLDKIENFISNWLEEMEIIEDRRVFDTHEAIIGIPGQKEFEPLNMKSSPGWPYQCRSGIRKAGKYHLFNENFEITDIELQSRLTTREEFAKRNERVASVWRDCLKDQLMSVEKVEKGKARLFTIPPVDFTILVRKYFLSFSANFYHNHNKFFHAVGITPESYEWTQLYHYLQECGDNVIAGDFGTFDGTLMPELLYRTIRIINKWYGDSEENQNVRRVIGNEIIHTMQLVENCVYSSHQGNPSGNPLTVIVNSICNLFYMLEAWLEIFPDKTLDDFRQNCRIVVYGDDNLISVKHTCKEFNQNSITKILAKYGIEYQSDAKDGKEVPNFRNLNEVTFLKRGFKIDKNISKNIVLPIMSIDTLYSYLYWFRKNLDDEEQLCANARSALCFAFFLGEDFYTDYFQTWQKCMKCCGYSVPFIQYSEWRDIFLHNCGLPKLEMEKFMDITNHKVSRTFLGILQAPAYYLCAAFGIGQVDDEVERTDDRWAVAIPSGEGKSYLCKRFPHIFVDHDELLLPAFKTRQVFKRSLPWTAEEARKHDFPECDRRILLVHHTNNTKRQIIGSFITHFPSFIRLNVLQRLMMKNPVKLDRDKRNQFLLNFARVNEPDLFAGRKVKDKQPLDRRK